MKKLSILFAIATLAINAAKAQGISLVKMHPLFATPHTPKTPVCYTPELLESISNEMYKSGNPKYVWVDLLKDQLIEDGTPYNFYIRTDEKDGDGNVPIPAQLQQQYVTKWKKFLISVEENDKYAYSFSSITAGVQRNFNSEDILNPESGFRHITKTELVRLNLNSKGEIRVLKEYVKDGLISLNEQLQLSLGPEGHIINGHKLSPELRDKYIAMYQEEFGCSYYRDGSKRARGGSEFAPTIAREIERLQFKAR